MSPDIIAQHRKLLTQQIMTTSPQNAPPNEKSALSAQPPSTSAKRRNRKKRKKRNSIASSDGDDAKTSTDAVASSASSPINNSTMVQSKLSLKKRMFLKKSARQTPWYDANELLDVGRGLLLALKLFPSPHQQQQQQQQQPCDIAGLTKEEHNQLRASLHRIALWRGRSDRGGRLPHAIDMSAGLAGILLMDAERSSSCVASSSSVIASTTTLTLTSLYQLRNAYSTLLLRSVNGLADTYRHQKKSASMSVSHCCALAGLPLWIVDVRHDASHNELPGLGVCRIGALESLRFWKGRYWDSLDERVWGKLIVSGSSTDDNMMAEGADGKEASSQEEGGICTQALDCLVRYQKAAMMEAYERADQKQAIRPTKKEEQRKQPAAKVTTNNGQDIAMQDSVMEEDKEEEEEGDGMIPVPSLSKFKASSRAEKSDINDETHAVDDSTNAASRSGGAIPWSILIDDKSKKKKKKTKTSDAVVEGNVNASVATENTKRVGKVDAMNAGPAPSPTVQTNPSVETSRDCAAQFVRTIPIDIAYSSALRFLVWGRSSYEPAGNNADAGEESGNGPALATVPLNLDLQPHWSATPMKQGGDVAFEQLRAMYDPLLIAMTNAYPGFVPALFVHLADSILCLDEARRNQLENNNGSAGGASEEMFDKEQIDHDIQCFSKWMRYILSREYHMHFDRTSAIYAVGSMQQQPLGDEPVLEIKLLQEVGSEEELPSPPVDLKKKKRKKWTSTELEYMRSPVEYSSLHEVGFPLNSVCDRLLAHQEDGCKSSPSTADARGESVVFNLRQHLENIIGTERVVFLGIYGHKEKEQCSMNEKGVAAEQVQILGDVGDDTVPANTIDGNVPDANIKASVEMNPNHISLEDMEAMLGDTIAKDDNESSPHSTGKNCADKKIHDGSNTEDLIKPWTFCEKWDACAIGTMPGCPA